MSTAQSLNEKVSLPMQIEQGLQDVKKMQEGTLPKHNIRDLVKELRMAKTIDSWIK